MLLFKTQQGQEPYAKVWKVILKENNTAIVQFSTSEKWTDKSGETQTKYSNWVAKFVGHAFNGIKAYGLDRGDVIRIKTIKFECASKKDDGGNWVNTYYVTVFDFEKQISQTSADNDSLDDTDYDLPL